MTDPWLNTSLESLEVGATPLVRHFLDRLQLTQLFQQHLPRLPGRQPALSTPLTLNVLITNLLLARQPLYAVPDWVARRVPEHFGMVPNQLQLLNDDRIGRARDHLRRADRASLLTAVVMQAVRVFALDLEALHQDTTTVTFSGQYTNQPRPEQADRPPRITFGYNKDHRPDLKQLLYSMTITADGAVPVHCKIYDGNTADDQVHIDTWNFLRAIIGHSDFLYVADSKLCTRENMGHIAIRDGRFLTVMPRTRAEDVHFREYVQDHALDWQEVHREANPRGRDQEDVVYQGVEAPSRSREGYRVLWYHSSQKVRQDREARQHRLQRARARLEAQQLPGRRNPPRTLAEARWAAERIVREEGVEGLLDVVVESTVEVVYRQIGPGRPGPDTEYRQEHYYRYQARFEENSVGLLRASRCDGLFPLMTNDEGLSVAEALGKYKYQPFVEKRHEQLKSVFGVAPMWLKNVGRVESLLWLYFVVELCQALLERAVRQGMTERGIPSLALYPEGRPHESPTAEVVFRRMEGNRRHRLLDQEGVEVRRFHDALPLAVQEVLEVLGVDPAPWGMR